MSEESTADLDDTEIKGFELWEILQAYNEDVPLGDVLNWSIEQKTLVEKWLSEKELIAAGFVEPDDLERTPRPGFLK